MRSVYCTPNDVSNFLLLQQAIDANSPVSEATLDSLIVQVEGDFERRTGRAYKPVFHTEEVHDLESLRSRHKELFDFVTVPRPTGTIYKPILPLTTTRGHKLEIYEGSELSGVWSEWLSTKTQGRDKDYWVDEEQGIIYIRKTFIPRRASLLRITYEHGFLPTQVNDVAGLTVGATTVTVDSTKKYGFEGWIRIGKEYIGYSGKTTTTFTGCERGIFNTEAAAHADDSKVFQVDDYVRHLVIKRAAAMFLENEPFIAVSGEGGQGIDRNAAVQRWNEEWNREVPNTFQRFVLL